MRNIVTAIAIGMCVLWACLLLAASIQNAHDAGHQPRNAYWPYSVETQLRDR